MNRFDTYATEQIEAMLEAGREVLECHLVLAKTGDNIVGQLLPKEGTFYEFDHCPAGDIFDDETHSQYYYHAHREGEHGHFHVFMREEGMPGDCKPVKQSRCEAMDERDDKICHLIAISMDEQGIPIKLFTTNRWVTGENWYAARDVARMVDRFSIGHAQPSWPVNRWVSAILRLFRPQIEEVLVERDAVVAKWRAENSAADIFENRELGLPSTMDISVDEQISALENTLAERLKSEAPSSAGKTLKGQNPVPKKRGIGPGRRKAPSRQEVVAG